MRHKAKEFYEEAKVLAAAKKYNGAASRLYYALYHLIIAIFEEKGIKQADLTRKVDPDNPGYWPHEVVRYNATLAGVARRDSRIVVELWDLRVKADYFNTLVSKLEYLGLLSEVERIFDDLGLTVK